MIHAADIEISRYRFIYNATATLDGDVWNPRYAFGFSARAAARRVIRKIRRDARDLDARAEFKWSDYLAKS